MMTTQVNTNTRRSWGESVAGARSTRQPVVTHVRGTLYCIHHIKYHPLVAPPTCSATTIPKARRALRGQSILSCGFCPLCLDRAKYQPQFIEIQTMPISTRSGRVLSKNTEAPKHAARKKQHRAPSRATPKSKAKAAPKATPKAASKAAPKTAEEVPINAPALVSRWLSAP